MECRDAQFYLRFRRPGADEIGPEAAADLDRHLADCPHCGPAARSETAFDRAVGAANWSAVDELMKAARDRKLAAREPAPGELQAIASALDKSFAAGLLLWQKTKNDLVEEMSTACRPLPGGPGYQ